MVGWASVLAVMTCAQTTKEISRQKLPTRLHFAFLCPKSIGPFELSRIRIAWVTPWIGLPGRQALCVQYRDSNGNKLALMEMKEIPGRQIDNLDEISMSDDFWFHVGFPDGYPRSIQYYTKLGLDLIIQGNFSDKDNFKYEKAFSRKDLILPASNKRRYIRRF
jgi:hypothetical protein